MYLSLLSKISLPNTNIFGIDLFIIGGQDLEAVELALSSSAPAPEKIRLIRDFSSEIDNHFNSGTVFDFIHVDGSHQYDHVYNDLQICDRRLDSDGVVIVDDFPKMGQMQVLEAVVDFLQANRDELVPVAVGGTFTIRFLALHKEYGWSLLHQECN